MVARSVNTETAVENTSPRATVRTWGAQGGAPAVAPPHQGAAGRSGRGGTRWWPGGRTLSFPAPRYDPSAEDSPPTT